MTELPLRARPIPTHSVRGAPGTLDASAAMIASLVAASVVLVAWIACSIAIYDEPAWKLPRMMAAMVLGPRVLAPEDELDVTVVATGFVLHFALALAFGTVLALLVRRVPQALAACTGALCGVALYAIDLHALTAFFPWFAPLRTLDTLAAHVLFGMLAATAYRELARTPRAPARPRQQFLGIP